MFEGSKGGLKWERGGGEGGWERGSQLKWGEGGVSILVSFQN